MRRHSLVGKLFHWELCKKFKFDQANKWYMHNPEPVLENETHTILRDFVIQTCHLILAKRPDLWIVNKKQSVTNGRLGHPVRVQSKTNIDQYMSLVGELKKIWNMKVTVITIVIGAIGTVTKGMVNKLEELEI